MLSRTSLRSSQRVAVVALLVAMLASACVRTVSVTETEVAGPPDLAVVIEATQDAEPDVQVAPEPAAQAQPVTPEPEATPEAETVLEPEAAPPENEAAEPVSDLFAATSGRAPVFATGTGGGCPADAWDHGFSVTFYLRDASELGTITSAVFGALFAISFQTLPQEQAWARLSDGVSTNPAFSQPALDDVFSGIELGIISLGEPPAEDDLAALIEDMRSRPSVLAITDDRCTNNATATLVP